MEKYVEKLYNKISTPFSKKMMKELLNLYESIEENYAVDFYGTDMFLYKKINNININEYSEKNKKISAEDYVEFYNTIVGLYKKSNLIFKVNPITSQNGWINADSFYVRPKEEAIIDVNHRFYISPKSEDLYKLASIILKTFESKTTPYRFKVIDYKTIVPVSEDIVKYRRDAIVMYCDDDNFKETLKTLLEIERDNKKIMSNCNKPSLIVGNINDCIGYAKEHYTKELSSSYTANFACCFIEGIDQYCKLFYQRNPHMIFKYKERGINKIFEFNYEKFYSTRSSLQTRKLLLAQSLLKYYPKEAFEGMYKEVCLKLMEEEFNLENIPFDNPDQQKIKKLN